MAHTLRLLLIFLCSLSECIQRRYHYIKTEMNWIEAQKYCREKYTDLATVNNMIDMNKLMKSVKDKKDVWIGLQIAKDYKWKWSLGDPVKYLNWKPNQNGQNNCVFMLNGEWHHKQCSESSMFICYNETIKGYIYPNSFQSWREAQSFCRQFHTDLASVRNQTENEHIQNIINNTQTSVWIGLFNDMWEWSDNSDSGFRNWKSEEPNYGSNSPFCAEVRSNENGQWNDLGCQNKRSFVCHEDKLVLIKQNLSWIDALEYCRRNHVDLVSVDSEEIQRWVTEAVKDASTAEVWLGLRLSCTVGIWFWVNGEFTCYENWAEGNETGMENCETVMRSGAVQSGKGHLWISLPETKRRNFICSRY